MKKVVDKFMAEINEQLFAKKVFLTLSPGARTWLAKRGHDPNYGARPLHRLLQTEIKDILSDKILFGQLEKGGKVFIDVKDDRLSFVYG
jgi:ATP-dependent Clp protease ATP-binding subunit ClpA